MFDNLINNILQKQKERSKILHPVDSAIFSTKNTGIKIRCSDSWIGKRFSPEFKQLSPLPLPPSTPQPKCTHTLHKSSGRTVILQFGEVVAPFNMAFQVSSFTISGSLRVDFHCRVNKIEALYLVVRLRKS